MRRPVNAMCKDIFRVICLHRMSIWLRGPPIRFALATKAAHQKYDVGIGVRPGKSVDKSCGVMNSEKAEVTVAVTVRKKRVRLKIRRSRAPKECVNSPRRTCVTAWPMSKHGKKVKVYATAHSPATDSLYSTGRRIAGRMLHQNAQAWLMVSRVASDANFLQPSRCFSPVIEPRDGIADGGHRLSFLVGFSVFRVSNSLTVAAANREKASTAIKVRLVERRIAARGWRQRFVRPNAIRAVVTGRTVFSLAEMKRFMRANASEAPAATHNAPV